MTKKDFELIAAVIQCAANEMDKTAHRMIALDFAHRLAAANPRFDRARFLKACGVAS